MILDQSLLNSDSLDIFVPDEFLKIPRNKYLNLIPVK